MGRCTFLTGSIENSQGCLQKASGTTRCSIGFEQAPSPFGGIEIVIEKIIPTIILYTPNAAAIIFLD